jgi:hypothetical protein
MVPAGPISRFSSRCQKLAQPFLAERLRGASLGILSATPLPVVWSGGGVLWAVQRGRR